MEEQAAVRLLQIAESQQSREREVYRNFRLQETLRKCMISITES